MPPLRLTSPQQVSGYRFLLRRLEHALVRRDTSMRDDPQSSQSRALAIGMAIGAFVLVACAVLAYFKPQGLSSGAKVVADRDSGAMYVVVGNTIHPVLNLVSARLIVGSPDSPQYVKTSELNNYPRGPMLGIPGAPSAINGNTRTDSQWAVCDSLVQDSAASTAQPTTTVIGGPISAAAGDVREVAAQNAQLMTFAGKNYLVYQGKRAEIDLANRAVTLALGIPSNATPAAMSRALFDAIPSATRIAAPMIIDAGGKSAFDIAPGVVTGSVVQLANDHSYYAVLKTGLQKITPAVADLLRDTNSYGAPAPIQVTPDVVTRTPVAGDIDVAAFPASKVALSDAHENPVTCFTWRRSSDDPTATMKVFNGRTLPLNAAQKDKVVDLVSAKTSGGVTADHFYLPDDFGTSVRITGADTDSASAESYYWVSDRGVRYGVDLDDQGKALSALGVSTTPGRAPWSIISLLAAGPKLSRSAALLAHDTLPADPSPSAVADGSSTRTGG